MITNTLQLLKEHLNIYCPQLILSDQSISDFTQFYYSFEVSSIHFESTGLYYILFEELADLEILQNKTNFLIILTKDKEFDNTLLGAQTNALLISLTSMTTNLYRSIQHFLTGVNKYKTISPQFMKGLVNRLSVPELLEMAEDVLNNSIILWDSEGQVAASSSRQMLNIPEWDDTIVREISPDKYATKEARIDAFTLINGFHYPFIENITYSPSRQICKTLYIDDRPAYTLIIFESRQSFQESDLPLVYYISEILCRVLENGHNKLSQQEMHSHFLRNIFSGSVTDPSYITRTAERLHINLKKINYIMVIRSVKIKMYDPNTNFTVLKHDINAMFPGAILCNYEDNLILLLSEDSGANIISKLELSLKRWKSSLTLALSLPFLAVDELKTAYEQCLVSLKLGPVFRPEALIFVYEDFLSYHFIASLSKSMDIKRFCLPLAWKIKKYDAENCTEYATTIYHFIKNLKDLDLASKKLNLHRNTVRYRIIRAAELFDIDMSNTTLLNNLLLSFEILLICELDQNQEYSKSYRFKES